MKLPILVVEDDPRDCELTLMALENCGVRVPVDVARDGRKARDYLLCEGNWAGRPAVNPSMVLLDMQLPEIDGVDVLELIRGTPSTRFVPIIAVAASNRSDDVERAYKQKVNAYIVKAFDLQTYVESMCTLLSAWSRNRTPH
ncbi:response regulator [Burkholderia sp. THE68]|uniref:response regulator n=1 Tax=Burkholderia sp. THE68 TaxID=758782 RepID=UPI0013160FD0|nr:response regulator [Burkholderia sp. THE68]BBU30379.1 response regulator [Burkholderia sp. THE68]